MAPGPVTYVPVVDDCRGYPWWIEPGAIEGIDLEAGTSYVLEVVISTDDDEVTDPDALRYELVDVVSASALDA